MKWKAMGRDMGCVDMTEESNDGLEEHFRCANTGKFTTLSNFRMPPFSKADKRTNARVRGVMDTRPGTTDVWTRTQVLPKFLKESHDDGAGRLRSLQKERADLSAASATWVLQIEEDKNGCQIATPCLRKKPSPTIPYCVCAGFCQIVSFHEKVLQKTFFVFANEINLRVRSSDGRKIGF